MSAVKMLVNEVGREQGYEYRAILVSPGKENQELAINSPTIRALDSFQKKQIAPDTSWDNADWVEMRQEEDFVVFRRDRPVVHHRKLKVTTINLRDQVQKLWAALEAQGEAAAKEREVAVKEQEVAANERETAAEEMRARVADAELSSILLLKAQIDNINRKLPDMEVVEEYEVVSLLLQGLNDRVFDVNWRDSRRRRKTSSRGTNCVTYLTSALTVTQLLTFCPPATGKQKLKMAFEKAKGLLTTEEWDLGLILKGHLTELRILPDREAVRKHMEVVAPVHTATVANLLASNLQRMPMAEDAEGTDRRLIVDAGEYHGPVEERVLRAELVEELRRLQARQAGNVKTGAKRQRSDSVFYSL
ncbi:hypothetical protein B0H10DRAFT_1947056 [Mycena sp. CBHHK59/15]|nr:hypothetical protein B0H10DRAFT_1947056 [Mycena sp. CBHHK59/15]